MFKQVLMISLALAAGPALAQSGTSGDPERGAALFAENCAACHGTQAVGDGPMAATLATPPRDLTALTIDGAFPTARIVRSIDGRDIVLHGGPMPLFGNLLKDESAVVDDADGTPVFTSQPVLDIVSWLETIQE